MKPAVSIIVPVYNAARSLFRCVDSVLEQKFSDFELLLVDDGSSDGSADACDAYARADDRVRVFHQKNSGVSAARNLALGAASGEFVQFLDSDDWLSPDATGLLVDAARDSGCGMVISDFYRVVGERRARKGDIRRGGALTLAEFSEQMIEKPADFYYGVLWNKLYRRDIIEAHGLRMDPAISWCEDFMFNLEYLRHIRGVFVLRVPVYYYVRTKGSLVARSSGLAGTIRMKKMVFEYYNNFYKNIFDEEEYEKNRLQLYRFLVDSADDGAVPPQFFRSGGRASGKRAGVPAADVSGFFADESQRAALMARCSETAARKYGLSPSETKLLLILHSGGRPMTRAELCACSGMSRGAFSLALQRLFSFGFIGEEERVGQEDQAGNKARLVFLPAAKALRRDLGRLLRAYGDACFAGFSEEDRARFLDFYGKMMENVRGSLG